MAYSAKDDVLKLISAAEVAELTSDAASGDPAVDEATVAEAIAKADAWIDGKLAKRYAVPISGTIPPLVKDGSAAIAVWFLRGRRQDGIDEATGDISKFYRDYFSEVGKGISDLPGLEERTEAEAGTSSVSGNVRVFTRDTLSGY